MYRQDLLNGVSVYSDDVRSLFSDIDYYEVDNVEDIPIIPVVPAIIGSIHDTIETI